MADQDNLTDVTAESSTAAEKNEANNAVTGEEAAASETTAPEKEKAVTEGESATPKRDAQARIRQLHAQTERAKEEAAYWRGRAESGGKTGPVQPVADSDPAPTPEQFKDYNDYLDARTGWVARQEWKTLEAKRQEENQKEAAKRQQSEAFNSYSERAKKTAEKYADFEEVAHSPNTPISLAMAETIRRSEMGPELAYHLGRNPQEAARIAQMEPLQAAVELGKLEARLSVAAAPVKKTTNSPPPITTVGGSGGGQGRDVFDESLSTEDRIAMWRKRA